MGINEIVSNSPGNEFSGEGLTKTNDMKKIQAKKRNCNIKSNAKKYCFFIAE